MLNVCVIFFTLGLHLVASRWRVLISLEKLGKGLADVLLLDSWQQGKRKERFQTPFFPVKGKTVERSSTCIYRSVVFKGGMMARRVALLSHGFRVHSFILSLGYCLLR